MMKYLEGKHSDVGTTWQMAQPKKQTNTDCTIHHIAEKEEKENTDEIQWFSFFQNRLHYSFTYLSSRKLNFSILNIN